MSVSHTFTILVQANKGKEATMNSLKNWGPWENQYPAWCWSCLEIQKYTKGSDTLLQLPHYVIHIWSKTYLLLLYSFCMYLTTLLWVFGSHRASVRPSPYFSLWHVLIIFISLMILYLFWQISQVPLSPHSVLYPTCKDLPSHTKYYKIHHWHGNGSSFFTWFIPNDIMSLTYLIGLCHFLVL
jgi:hypothetical protein